MKTADPTPINLEQGARDQAILPLRVAFGLCLRGIHTRLGRSFITLSGVGLGIAFLMSVLSAFHIKDAMRVETERALDVGRRVAAVRAEVGMLEGRLFQVFLGEPDEADLGFVDAMHRQRAVLTIVESRGARAATDASAVPQDPVDLHAVFLLGNGSHLLLPAEAGAWLREGLPVVSFDAPAPGVAEQVAAAGAVLKELGVALRPEEIERHARREREARYRMIWIVAVSLLITVGGIANAMLMSVTERFREIATMKCLGALSSFVVKLFLIESSIIGLAGALAGSLAGVLFSILTYSYTFGMGNLLAAVRFDVLAAYAGVCAAVGVTLAVIAGIYPARVAARMIPAAALSSHI